MKTVTMFLAGASLSLIAGCGDALVGGKCADGYVANGDECVFPRDLAGSVSASSGAGGSGGQGDGGAGSGGKSSSSTSSGTANGGAGGSTGSTTASSGTGENGGNGGAGGGTTTASTGTALMCFPPLANCDGLCTDLSRDAAHCGACDISCSTSGCIDGVCGGPVGDTPKGATIVLGMNFGEVELGGAEAVLLGNAVFSAPHEPLRLLDYQRYVAPGSPAFTSVGELVFDEAIIRDRTLEAFENPSTAEVAIALESPDFDVLLVRDQDAAPAGILAGVGSILRQPILDFTARGGVVVVLASTSGVDDMGAFLTSGFGFSSPTLQDASGQTLTRVGQGIGLARGLPATFSAGAWTATLPSTLTSNAPLQFLVTAAAGPVALVKAP